MLTMRSRIYGATEEQTPHLLVRSIHDAYKNLNEEKDDVDS
jgi:hypothetical protein